MGTAFRKVLPHPFLSLLLAVTWCLLTNSAGVNAIVLGIILGVLVPQLTAAYWPGAPRLARPGKMAVYVLIVLWDILIANISVAWIVVTKANRNMRPTWVIIPLELRTPEAISILAGTITLTPGTVSADLSDEGHCLLVHALDAESSDAVRDEIKTRYERRLKEMFE